MNSRMPSNYSFKLLVFLFILVSFLSSAATTKAQGPTFLYQSCSSNRTTANSTYQLNLRTQFSSLSSNATTDDNFYTTVSGGRNPSDTVHGLFMLLLFIYDMKLYQLLYISLNICGKNQGLLPSGQEIAVKRLSKSSGQGGQEFKNEVELVAQLQHRHLVRILGFCLEREEKILVYEFLANKSLDYILFDPEKQRVLDWTRRYKIIGGIARGIQYLHEDSRLKIIHHDLKASNILLDSDMNPKISDFGMAKLFGVDQTQGNTSRIVGTYGYMSPEYAMHGEFSIKSDVYSFGVLIMEIISGKKNNSFYETDVAEDLMSYAWKLWRDGAPLELMEHTLRDSYNPSEVIRCIHIGLLCVQEDPTDRPTMATIMLMLDSYSVTLPAPNQPALFLHSGTDSNMPRLQITESTTNSIPKSVNEMSVSEIDPR